MPSRLSRLYEQTEQIVTIDKDAAPRLLFSGEDILLEDLPVGTRVIYPKPPIEGLPNVKPEFVALRRGSPRPGVSALAA